MTTTKLITLDEIVSFRRALGIRAIVVEEDCYTTDDDVDSVDPGVAFATLSIEIAKIEREVWITENRLRDWKAKMTNSILAKDPKMAQWKVSSMIEGEPVWLATKNSIAELKTVLSVLTGFSEAVKL